MRTIVFILSLGFLSQASAQQAAEIILAQPAEQTSLSAPMPSASSNTEMLPFVIIPAKTPVHFTLDTAISSKTSLPGEQFQLKVAEDVMINGAVAIPAGTPATGEIIHAQKSSVFGKAGELHLVIRYIDFHGVKIKMRLFQPYQGKDATKAAMGSVFFIGAFAAFIRGGEIQLPENTFVQALVANETAVKLPLAMTEKTAIPVQNPTPLITGDSQ
jgi:hypothetical protein